MISGVIQILIADSTLASLLGESNGAPNVFVVVATERANKTYLTVRRVGGNPAINKTDVSEVDTIFFQVAAFSETYEGAVNALSQVRVLLDFYTGTSNSIVFKKIWWTGSEDKFDESDSTYVVIDTYTARYARSLT
jgi:hypothetical protein